MALETSILRSIRQRIGPSSTYDVFDTDLIVNINTSFSRLRQLGVGPSTPFRIYDESATWDDFQAEADLMEDVKQYIYLKAKLIFDPPQSGSVINMYNQEAEKLEWLLKEVSEFGY